MNARRSSRGRCPGRPVPSDRSSDFETCDLLRGGSCLVLRNSVPGRPRPPSSGGFLRRRQSAPPRSGARTRLNDSRSPPTNPPPRHGFMDEARGAGARGALSLQTGPRTSRPVIGFAATIASSCGTQCQGAPAPVLGRLPEEETVSSAEIRGPVAPEQQALARDESATAAHRSLVAATKPPSPCLDLSRRPSRIRRRLASTSPVARDEFAAALPRPLVSPATNPPP